MSKISEQEFIIKESIQSINVSIDRYVFNKESGKFNVVGWAFSNISEKVSYNAVGKKFGNTLVKRPDVYSAFDSSLEQALMSGFNICVDDVGKKDNVVIEIIADEGKCVIEFDIKAVLKKQSNEKIAFIKNNFNKENLMKLFLYLKANGIRKTIIKTINKTTNNNIDTEAVNFKKWIDKYENYNKKEVKKTIAEFNYKPLISVCMTVYNTNENNLKLSIDSVINQYYEKWKLYIIDIGSQPQIKPVLDEYLKKDSRIKVVYREKNDNISVSENYAVDIAEGEFITFMYGNDELSLWALYETAKLLNKYPNADFIYGDEDKLEISGERTEPYFKPSFSSDTLLSYNYISNTAVYRKSLLIKTGAFREEFEGAHNYDLILRFTENTDKIYHIPRILYHSRIIEEKKFEDKKENIYNAGFKALDEAIKRRGYNAKAVKTDLNFYDIKFYPNKTDFVSVIIPTKDKADILDRCIKSIYEKTLYKNYEIIVIDNNSEEKETFELFERYKKYDNFRVLEQKIPFNYSKINNAAAKIAKGNLLLFLNNDIEVISENWMEKMAGEACRKEVGAVGVKLLYPNNTVQHGGVVLVSKDFTANHVGVMLHDSDSGYFSTININRNYSAVTAACMMMKKSVFEEIGGFEEKLAVAYNDVDLCLKAVNHGYNNIYLGTVKLYHYESLSRGQEDSVEKIKRFDDEKNYLNSNWSEIIENDPYYNPDYGLRLLELKLRS